MAQITQKVTWRLLEKAAYMTYYAGLRKVNDDFLNPTKKRF